MKKFLTLYPTSVIVKGAIRSTISDLQKNDFHYVPNDLTEVVNHLSKTDCDEFINDLTLEDQATIKEYISFLIDNDLAFFSAQPKLYPKINLQFHASTKINNAILDRNEYSQYNIFDAITELDNYNCKHLQIRFYSTIKLENLERILEHVQETNILTVEIFYKFNNDKLTVIKKVINRFTKIKLLLVHSAPFSKMFVVDKKRQYTSRMGAFIYTDEAIISEQNCGCISFSYFTVNLKSFSESINYNSCLKSKLSIDVNGKIKNCPTLQTDYGTFGENTFDKVLNDSQFLSFGDIKKDNINVCKDCEHRYFCSDCRAFVSELNDKPSKCSYNPYTAKWETNA